MSAKYKVSVIIPIYNVAEYLEECLESMVRQTIDSLEVIMVDDGSTDISGVIAQEYEKNYDNFFYYLKENGGLGNARNYGIQFVHGDYIIFLDSDDIVSLFTVTILSSLILMILCRMAHMKRCTKRL